jgi:hypothetical protein
MEIVLYQYPKLCIKQGGRKDLGRQLLRAMIEFRSDDVRAIADRIAHRGQLKSVDVGGESHPGRIDMVTEPMSSVDSPEG